VRSELFLAIALFHSKRTHCLAEGYADSRLRAF